MTRGQPQVRGRSNFLSDCPLFFSKTGKSYSPQTWWVCDSWSGPGHVCVGFVIWGQVTLGKVTNFKIAPVDFKLYSPGAHGDLFSIASTKGLRVGIMIY